MLLLYWPAVFDVGPTIKQHCATVSGANVIFRLSLKVCAYSAVQSQKVVTTDLTSEQLLFLDVARQNTAFQIQKAITATFISVQLLFFDCARLYNDTPPC